MGFMELCLITVKQGQEKLSLCLDVIV